MQGRAYGSLTIWLQRVAAGNSACFGIELSWLKLFGDVEAVFCAVPRVKACFPHKGVLSPPVGSICYGLLQSTWVIKVKKDRKSG